MDNILSHITGPIWWLHLLMVLLGLVLGYFMFKGKAESGDLNVEGENQLRADADGLRARVAELEGRVGRRDTTISGLESQLSATPATATAATSSDDDKYALEWRNRYLAARVKYLEGRISEAPKPKKKAPAKKKATTKKTAPKKALAAKAPAKKAVAKKVVAKKAVAAKSTVKKAVAKKAAPKKTVAKKTAPKKTVAKKTAAKKAPAKKAPAKKKAAANPNEKYYAMVHKHDARASKTVIDSIVKYCGVSLRSRDASLVACSDEKELDRIAKGFAVKKLGLKTGQAELVADTCQKMKATRMKNRVAFYYLMAKKAGKLSVFK